MRKQTKIAAVVSAAALLALGASITSFAAAKGTWMMVDGEWYCYDKNGDAYENTFCSSNGKEYYVGLLITADDYKYQVAEILGKKFIVNSNGSIQHGNVEYKEDGDVLIDTRKVVDKDNNNAVIYNAVTYNNATGATKNCITGGDLRNNVEEIDVNKVMNFNAEN